MVPLTPTNAGAHSPFVESNRERRTNEGPLVTVVDDDISVREALPDRLMQFGFAARAFSSAEEFLSSDCVDQTRCLILDIVMPGMTGLDLQRELKLRGHALPIIFITGQKEERIRRQALAQGAVRFLHKPFGETVLLEAVTAALRGK
jgi:FixJ family two-component response regulator